MLSPALQKFLDWVMGPELETILHPSRRRLQWLGIFTLVGHLLFLWLWTVVLPQPFEDWRVRLAIALTGLGLIFQPASKQADPRSMALYFSFVCWVQLPVFFIWMYWMNSGSAMWMATVATMFVVYYHLTDWRIATFGTLLGGLVATLVAKVLLGALHPIPLEHLVVFVFSIVCAALLSLSSANLRRERLKHSLTVIGIMAHELRTPLATLSLIAQAIRAESQTNDALHAKRLQELATRTDALTRAINHHIDLQMANARCDFSPNNADLLSAGQIVRKVVDEYPFGSRKERHCLRVVMHQDFWFRGSERQFVQVLNNLIKNAMHSLKSAQSRYSYGDLHIELGMRGQVGRIQITDNGIGINSQQLGLIFEPFFSTANETGHGLGLAFCKQVIEQVQGQISVYSEPAMGATFIIQLPCQPAPSDDTLPHHEVSPLSPA